MSILYVDEIRPKDNAKIIAEDLQLPAGSILQVVNSQSTSTSSVVTTSSTYVDYLTVSITPTSSTSKFLLMFDSTVYLAATTSTAGGGCYFDRNGTPINVGEQPGAHNIALYSTSPNNLHAKATMNWIDSPNSSSTLTYKVKVNSFLGTVDWGNSGHSSRSFTVMEIAQ